MNASCQTAAAAARSRSCPSSPLQQRQKSSRLCTPPTSGRSTPVTPLLFPPLALPRAAAALAALSIEMPTTTAEAARESAAAPISSNHVAAPPRDPIEAENEALAEFVSWLIANGEEVAKRARARDIEKERTGRTDSVSAS